MVAESIERAVERVVAAMRDNLGDDLTVDDMARVAMFSKFHFTRMFHRVTGVTPRRFLSALRLAQAKHLLVSTSLSVVDICIKVGYNSVGTFSSRFSRSVGLSPTAYRRLAHAPSDAMLAATPVPANATGVVTGTIRAATDKPPGLVFIGLFPSRIPEGRPARCAILDGPGPYRLDKVPVGVWYVLCQSLPTDATQRPDYAHPDAGLAQPTECRRITVGAYGPVEVEENGIVDGAGIELIPVRPLDPPALFALFDTRPESPDGSSAPTLASESNGSEPGRAA